MGRFAFLRSSPAWLAVFLAFCAGPLGGQAAKFSCSSCAEWNAPQAPFRIYGNTYYVGPHGLSSILITSDGGDVLIDGDLEQSAPLIAANIRSLGFRIEDVKLILNSHVHFDHAAGIAELQRLSGATVMASKWSGAVLKSGMVGRADPQYGTLPPIPRVAHVRILHDGESLHLGTLVMTAHATPGHTPGGTSWTWRSCEKERCLDMVYADSLSPIAADGFRFTKSSVYPHAIQDFQKSFQFLDTAPCDILITPHAQASQFWERVAEHQKGAKPDPLIDPSLCRQLAESSKKTLEETIHNEEGH